MCRMMRWMMVVVVWGMGVVPLRAADEMPGRIRGMVVDAKTREPMEFVNVSVRKVGTTVPLGGSVTDHAGDFAIGKLPDGEYTLSISFIGYKTFEKNFSFTLKNGDVNMRTIALEPDAKMLNEVEIVGQKSQMKFEIDKKVFNVDQNIASTGGTASDVLTNIPSVEVDNEGEVSLRGSTSVTVWINGKASGLSADNRAQVLEQLPAESIDRIEVITNPSAKYSPEGTSGIINIVLKEDRKAGYFGSLQVGANTRGGWNASGNINYSSSKIDAYANVGYRRRKMEGKGLNERTNLDRDGNPVSYLNQRSENDGHGGPVFARAGLTFHPTKKDKFNLGGFGMFGDNERTTDIRYKSNVPGSFVERLRTTATDGKMKGGNVELGYHRDFSKTENLDLSVSWNPWNMDGTSLYRQASLYEDGREDASFQRQESNVHSKGWEFQADYVNAFSENSKIEAGYKGNLSKEKSPVETASGRTAADAQPDKGLYNTFFYDRDVQALYATYSGRIGNFGF